VGLVAVVAGVWEKDLEPQYLSTVNTKTSLMTFFGVSVLDECAKESRKVSDRQDILVVERTCHARLHPQQTRQPSSPYRSCLCRFRTQSVASHALHLLTVTTLSVSPHPTRWTQASQVVLQTPASPICDRTTPHITMKVSEGHGPVTYPPPPSVSTTTVPPTSTGRIHPMVSFKKLLMLVMSLSMARIRGYGHERRRDETDRCVLTCFC